MQEMSHSFSIKTMWRSFFCALMATVTLSVRLLWIVWRASHTVTLQAMNPFRTGKLVLFQVTYDRDWHFFEIMFFIILGIFGVRLPSSSSRDRVNEHALTGSLRCLHGQVQPPSRRIP